MTTKITAPDRQLDYNKVEQHLINQIKDYVANKAKSTTCIVWVSGWIDSAVVSTLVTKTNLQTILLTMPIHQKNDEVTRADEHIAQLKANYPNVTHLNIDLTQTYETIKKELEKTHTQDELYMALVNTRSRLRMTTLYAIGNTYNWIVIWTGNKVEDYGIWFFTKYGDGGVDYSPIGELLKSEVYKLWAQLNVPTSILQARPTDWLHPNGATDEDQIWATYDELEWAMDQYDQGKRTPDFTQRQAEVMEIYTNRHLANAHKMQMPPVATIQ